MQKNNIVIMGIIALILFLPSTAKTEVQTTWLDKTDKYELLSNEGLVAFSVNESEVQNQPEKVDEVKNCECNGTKQIRTGDNRVIPCPCKDCKCSSKINLNSGDAPKEDTQKKKYSGYRSKRDRLHPFIRWKVYFVYESRMVRSMRSA